MNKKALLPLIGLFLLVTGIVLPGSAYAQISEGGTPTSFKYQNTLKSDLPTVQIPINFSVEDLKTVDRWQVSQGFVYNYFLNQRKPENSRQMAGQPRGTAESRSFTPDRPDNRQCW